MCIPQQRHLPRPRVKSSRNRSPSRLQSRNLSSSSRLRLPRFDQLSVSTFQSKVSKKRIIWSTLGENDHINNIHLPGSDRTFNHTRHTSPVVQPTALSSMPEEAGLNLNFGGSPYHLSAEITDYGNVNVGCRLDGVERGHFEPTSAPHTGEQKRKNLAEDLLSPRIVHQHPQFLANVSIQSG